MPIEGDYAASPAKWVRDQVTAIETSGGAAGTTMRGMPVVVVTMRGAKSGKIRKVPLMRVEHDGVYALVASMGGAPKNPVWYHNLVADPRVDVQDGVDVRHDLKAREIDGAEYDTVVGARRRRLPRLRRLQAAYGSEDPAVPGRRLTAPADR